MGKSTTTTSAGRRKGLGDRRARGGCGLLPCEAAFEDGWTFDLPTEAQGEYACRAGTTTALNSGKNLTAEKDCPNMAKPGRYQYNRKDGKGGYGEHTKVGSYLPNVWGLYDMHGNMRDSMVVVCGR